MKKGLLRFNHCKLKKVEMAKEKLMTHIKSCILLFFVLISCDSIAQMDTVSLFKTDSNIAIYSSDRLYVTLDYQEFLYFIKGQSHELRQFSIGTFLELNDSILIFESDQNMALNALFINYHQLDITENSIFSDLGKMKIRRNKPLWAESTIVLTLTESQSTIKFEPSLSFGFL